MPEHPNDGLVRQARGIKRAPCILLLVGLGVFAFVFGPGRVVPPDEDRASGPRREIRSMAEIEPFIDDGTLLVFDLDNTLIEPVGNLGSDQWFSFLIRKYTEVDRLGEKEAAVRREMDVWNKAQWLVEVKAVEPLTPSLIRRQQDRGIKTMGLTAREPEIAGRTLAQLERVGVRLGRAAVHQAEWKAGGALFKQGILFVGEGRDKGDELVKFLREIQFAPAKVLFVDDRPKNVDNVERALKREGIAYLVFRYGATDAKVEQFNRDTEDPQLFALGVLTEKAAEAVKRAGKE